MKTDLKNKKSTFYGVKDSSATFSIKDVDSVGRTICFVANTFNFFDYDKDILLPGCADKSIMERGPKSSAPDKIQHALFHDLTRIQGKIKLLEEREMDGKIVLYCESKLSDSTEGSDTLKNYLAEIYNQHSIGFQYMQVDMIEKDAHGNSKQWQKMIDACVNPADMDAVGYAYVVSEIKLFENSTVAFGANKLTPTLLIKSANKDAVMADYFGKLDKLNKTLKDGTQSDGMMKMFELQVLQLKQMITELFETVEIKNAKSKPTLMTCSCGCDLTKDDIDTDDMVIKCPSCGKCYDKTTMQPKSLIKKLDYKKLNKMI